jgi:LPS-assembly lipoprotein
MSRSRAWPVAAALATALLLSACGLSPVYSGGSQGVAAQLGTITVAPIPDRSGYLVRNALQARLGKPGDAAAYRLEVELDDQIEGFGIRGDDSITRERRTLRARYRLVSVDGARTFLDATARADAGVDVVRSSNLAVVAAENSQLERLSDEIARQIAARIAVLMKTSPDFAPERK